MQMSISEFKAKCTQVVREVGTKYQTVELTNRGKVVAQVVPPEPETKPDPQSFFGSLRAVLSRTSLVGMSRSARMIGKPASEVLARHPCVDLGLRGTGKTARSYKEDAAGARSPTLWASGDQSLGSGEKGVQGAFAIIYACAPVGRARHPSPVYRASAPFGGYSPRIGAFACTLPQRPGRPNDRRHSAAAQSGADQCRSTAARLSTCANKVAIVNQSIRQTFA